MIYEVYTAVEPHHFSYSRNPCTRIIKKIDHKNSKNNRTYTIFLNGDVQSEVGLREFGEYKFAGYMKPEVAENLIFVGLL